VTSVGSRGDSYDNARAESVIGLYKAELVRHRGPWRGLDDLESRRSRVDW
jgi:putative transposase